MESPELERIINEQLIADARVVSGRALHGSPLDGADNNEIIPDNAAPHSQASKGNQIFSGFSDWWRELEQRDREAALRRPPRSAGAQIADVLLQSLQGGCLVIVLSIVLFIAIYLLKFLINLGGFFDRTVFRGPW